MWYPKDVATWLALAALILVIPFNFFSSWAYPKIQDWWAARSRKSLKKRIDKLSASLASMEQGGIRISDDFVLMCAERLATLIFWGVTTLLFAMTFLMAPVLRNVIHHRSIIVTGMSIFFAVFKGVKDYAMWEISGFRRSAGPIKRMELERSLDDLTAKLAAREQRSHLA